MDKQKALKILQSIHKDEYEQWVLPHHYQRCNKAITLPNGEDATLVVEDAVCDFLDYVKKLIEKEEDI